MSHSGNCIGTIGHPNGKKGKIRSYLHTILGRLITQIHKTKLKENIEEYMVLNQGWMHQSRHRKHNP